MTNTQHTPGPWQQYDTEVIAIDARGNVTKVADLCEPAVPYSASVMDANGALLAAAPELLSALKGVLAWYAALPETGVVAGGLELSARLREAKAAIVRAEGVRRVCSFRSINPKS